MTKEKREMGYKGSAVPPGEHVQAHVQPASDAIGDVLREWSPDQLGLLAANLNALKSRGIPIDDDIQSAIIDLRKRTDTLLK